ncbi:MAG: hypothetical protein E6Q73_03625 [Pseudorhodobacter sp.]|nr:MAG: hypothetical protein E6Q73_03625 [Pseudorhodobacter sp.]
MVPAVGFDAAGLGARSGLGGFSALGASFATGFATGFAAGFGVVLAAVLGAAALVAGFFAGVVAIFGPFGQIRTVQAP